MNRKNTNAERDRRIKDINDYFLQNPGAFANPDARHQELRQYVSPENMGKIYSSMNPSQRDASYDYLPAQYRSEQFNKGLRKDMNDFAMDRVVNPVMTTLAVPQAASGYAANQIYGDGKSSWEDIFTHGKQRNVADEVGVKNPYGKFALNMATDPLLLAGIATNIVRNAPIAARNSIAAGRNNASAASYADDLARVHRTSDDVIINGGSLKSANKRFDQEMSAVGYDRGFRPQSIDGRVHLRAKGDAGRSPFINYRPQVSYEFPNQSGGQMIKAGNTPYNRGLAVNETKPFIASGVQFSAPVVKEKPLPTSSVWIDGPIIPEHRYEQVRAVKGSPDFERWFDDEIKRHGEGATSVYPGDGKRKILIRGTKPIVRREVYNADMMNVPDSTTVSNDPSRGWNYTRELDGRVNGNPRLSNKRLNTYGAPFVK